MKSHFQPFAMERWQSLHENRVQFNLSESGVHPLTIRELGMLAGGSFDDIVLGYGQSNGSERLRTHITRLYEQCSLDNIVVTNGSAEANFIALWELSRPGDEIVIIAPTYMQAHGVAGNFGVRVREVWLREEQGWQLDADELESAVTSTTRVIVVTNPGNPTGAVMSNAARAAVLRAAHRTGCWILADEVYRGAEMSGAETRSFFGEHDRVIATGSLSKAYGLPGIRVGWGAAPPEMAARLWARKDYLTISPGELTDQIAATALSPAIRPRILERTRGLLREGWETTRNWMDDVGIFNCVAPEAGAISYARYDLPVESADFAEFLRAEYSVLVVPGSHFGMGKFVRLGLGAPGPGLRAALDRVTAAIKHLR
jgi:aspartate/methionine/tyrosine aminotransferase